MNTKNWSLINIQDNQDEVIMQENDTSINFDRKEDEYSVMNALRDRIVFTNLVVAMIWFASASFNYHLMGFYLKYMGGDIYINTLVSTLSDTISNIAVSYIQTLLGTKTSFILWFAFSALFAIPLLFPLNSIQIVISVFLSKFFCEGTFWLAYFMNPELFDPLFVPFSISACSLCARIITLAAPQFAEVQPRQVPIIAYLLTWSISTFAAMFLKKQRKN